MGNDKENKIFILVLIILILLAFLFLGLIIAFSVNIYKIYNGSLKINFNEAFSAVNLSMFQILIAMLTIVFAVTAIFVYSGMKDNIVKTSEESVKTHLELFKKEINEVNEKLNLLKTSESPKGNYYEK